MSGQPLQEQAGGSCCQSEAVVKGSRCAPAVPAGSCCGAPSPATAPTCCQSPPAQAEATGSDQTARTEPGSAGGKGARAYLPLAVLVGGVGLATAALQLSWPDGARSAELAMSQFMGLFLLVFAMLKLFDLPGFASGFARYDLAAGAFRPYGYLYPFLELGLGLALLAGLRPLEVNGFLAVLMLFGAVGVLRSLRRGESLRCACMGSSLDVPLSTVALVEDLAMGLMSLAMLGMQSSPG
jgi:hypothetical protein